MTITTLPAASDAAACLASDAASYITGEIVGIYCGRMTLNYTVPV